jgi:uncharacterized repeat protein (TIGR01451 family)
VGKAFFLKRDRAAAGRRIVVYVVAALALAATLGVGPAAGANQAADLDQCANGTLASPQSCPPGWQNGDLNGNNSHYREGDSVPFRAVLTNLSLGSHTLVIEYDTLASGKHAYDYLTTYNRTVGSADPCAGVATCVPGASGAIPVDPSIAFANPSSSQVPGAISIWNGSVTGVAYGGADPADKRSLTITFTAAASTAVLAWGGHVASQIDWGSGNSAGSISGSPYHNRILSLDGAGGNQDRSMKAAAILPTPAQFETQAQSSSIKVGQSVTDTALLSGANGPVSGSVAFFVCGPSLTTPDCTSGGSPLGSASVANGSATSAPFSPSSPGRYCFRAEYTPDVFAPYSPANHTNTTVGGQYGECFDVTQVTVSVVTTIRDASENAITSAAIGSVVHDTVVVSGNVGTPTGNVTFTLYSGVSDCSGNGSTSAPVALVNGAAASGTTTVPPGGLSYRAHYLGDGTYNAADGDCEPLQATKLTPSAVTTIHDANHNPVTTTSVGASVHDSATVTGSQGVPTGTVSFSWYASQDCTGNATAAGTVQLDGSGVAHPSSTVTVPPGGGSFQAHYNGDATYNGADATCEPLDAQKLDTQVATTIHDANESAITSAPIGSIVHDSATVTSAGGSIPTGSLTFWWNASQDCTGPAYVVSVVHLDANGVAHPSDNVVVPAGGGGFVAHYNGDAGHKQADGPCEPLQATKLDAHAVTTIHDSNHGAVTSAPIGSVVHDSATVSGAQGTPTGSVDFAWYASKDCTGASTAAGTVQLDAAGVAHPSDTRTVPVGGGSFKAHYSGDSTYNGADAACEPLDATKLVPNAVTTIHDAAHQAITSAPIGSVVHDSATVSGTQGVPTGSVSFSWYASKDCTGASTAAGTVQLNANAVAHPSDARTVPVGGGSFKAHYSGNATYAAADAACEPLDASKLDARAVTTIHDAAHNPVTSAPIGSVVHDSATVSGAQGTPSGSVDFRWYTSKDCTGASIAAGTVQLDAAGIAHPSDAQSVPVGGGSFKAHYNGDSTYNAADADCEPLDASKLDAHAVTTIHDAAHAAVTSAPIGSVVHDSATVTGTQAGGIPTGTVEFSWYASKDCTGAASAAGTVQLDAGGIAHPSQAVTVPSGGGSFRAHYNGDSTYNSANADCEPLDASKLDAHAVTTIHDAGHAAVTSAPVGSVVHDSATVTGTQVGGMPTGGVTFSWYTSKDCSGPAKAAGTVQLDAGGVAHPSDGETVPAGGASFKAHYNGDATYKAVDADCEPLDSSKLDASAVTTIHSAAHAAVTSAPIGSAVHDSAAVTGTQAGGTPTGSVDFKWYTSRDCTGAAKAAGSVQLDAKGVAHPSDAQTVPVGGGSFKAHYNGDATYNAADADCEPLAATKLTPSVVTTIHDASENSITSAAIGAVVHDSATVSGSQGTPTGTVSFTLYNGTGCSGTAKAAGSVQLNGSGFGHPSDTATVGAGGLSFRAHYSGDSVYTAGDGDCEPLEAKKLTPKVVTTIHDANHAAVTRVLVGSTVHDSATVTGTQAGGAPTGSVSFSWYTTTNCTGTAKSAGSAQVDANGVAHPSDNETVPAGGGSFKAHYNGDATYDAADADCEPLQARPLTTLEVVKNLLPSTDGGRFDLTIDGATKAAGVGDGGTTGKVVVEPGTHTVGEVAAAGTDLGEYTASVSCSAGGTQLAKADGSSTSLDVPEGANAVCTITNTRKSINLWITKVDTPDPATLGGSITYTLVVHNDGPGTATGVKVSDPLPPELSFQSVSATQGKCTGGVVISCDLGTLAPGASVTITVLAKTTRTGVVTNTAVVVGDQPESKTDDNQATATTLVQGPFTPPSTCETVTVAPHLLKVGHPTKVNVRVRAAGKAVRGVKVRARGAGMNQLSRPTNFAGLVRMLLKPQRPGIVTFSVVGRKTCRQARVGVIGVVTPPVTG